MIFFLDYDWVKIASVPVKIASFPEVVAKKWGIIESLLLLEKLNARTGDLLVCVGSRLLFFGDL